MSQWSFPAERHHKIETHPSLFHLSEKQNKTKFGWISNFGKSGSRLIYRQSSVKTPLSKTSSNPYFRFFIQNNPQIGSSYWRSLSHVFLTPIWKTFTIKRHTSLSLYFCLFTFVYLLGVPRLPYTREREKNRLFMNTQQIINFSLHVIASPLVPYNYACPKRGLIHWDRVMQLMKQALYLQATTAG